MNSMTHKFSVTAILFLGCITAADASIVTYDASLGTLPDAQSSAYSMVNTSSSNPPYTFVGDALHQGPTTVRGYQYWDWACDGYTFDFEDGFTFEITLRIESADFFYRPNGGIRAGFAVTPRDNVGRIYRLGFGTDRIALQNSNQTNADIDEILFDTTDDFHTYRFELNSGVANVFIDGAATASLTVTGLGATGVTGSTNRVNWGDVTISGGNESLVRSFSFEADGHQCGQVPEPGSILIWLAAGVPILCGICVLRSRRKATTQSSNSKSAT